MEKQQMDMTKIRHQIQDCDKLLIGIGEEWSQSRCPDVLGAYEDLYRLVKGRDYFIVTMATDAIIYESPLGSREETVQTAERRAMEIPGERGQNERTRALLDRLFPVTEEAETLAQRIVAPCGNETWRQCGRACTKDIWEPGEISDGRCPHCGAPLVGNTIDADVYIEEGYLPQWNHYTRWLSNTLNRRLVILELGVGFSHPQVIRFAFEKTAFFNQKAYLYRVNRQFAQITEELAGRAEPVSMDSVEFVRELAKAQMV